ncbi:phosphopantothenoylcysteine decarboxylase subunit VHS3 isoform X2 [Cryptomeria japonica]|uniref:phosphopantothenoylcysteine decarboxylase subunit VHS3 isoform X2 n=1 Tax=Cryptomeria japonica TaxID=3369 RepID=UPI0027DAA927|nr:phosphopantothenoylcysteine decarboxylase subunit VHS3 isoform X2 [Cryptomeria japonica]
MFQTEARIIPLFYHVPPSDFRHIKNGVAKAFREHEEKGRYPSHDIQQWKECLQNVSGIKGFELNGHNHDLGKLCNQVVSAVVKVMGGSAKTTVVKNEDTVDENYIDDWVEPDDNEEDEKYDDENYIDDDDEEDEKDDDENYIDDWVEPDENYIDDFSGYIYEDR